MTARKKKDPAPDPLARLREVCLGLPETSERPSHGVPAFFVRGKKVFTMYVELERDGDRPTIWCPAPPDAQDEMVREEPERFFVPPFVGRSGWVGVRLDVDLNWEEVAEIIRESYRQVAPKKLASLLD
ncbi:MmcQ/YjbR family DNA-binding protein [Amycolatopsis sp. NPDC004079]|uniref:MmcQ/YjbR family DNA-binding protein n=1 Tax=Amycolatopsis sp. NPDC004079 TaxID=3154549 RepID=UPI0033A50916